MRATLLLVFVLTCASRGGAQTVEVDTASARLIGSIVPNEKPLAFGQPGDGYPEQIIIEGVIEAASPVSAYCSGIIGTWSGTVAIRLTAQAGFPDELVYVALPCLAGPDAESEVMGKHIRIIAWKLYPGVNDEPFGWIWNRLDINGRPLYGTGRGWRELLTTK